MKKYLLVTALFIISISTLASNIKVFNVGLTSQNLAQKTWMVKFDLSWDNSWNISGSSSNYDAAWVFVKYRVNRGAWATAFLNNNGHVIVGSSSPSITIDPSLLVPTDAFSQSANPAVGVFIYRSNSSLASGTNSCSNIQLKWNYGANLPLIADDALVDIRVFAVEMVYIPAASFAIGSGSLIDNEFTITTINTSSATTIPSGVGSLGGSAGGFPSGNLSPTTNQFPNGYATFYAMKYEISQQQYVDFLNTLTRVQQELRFSSATVGDYLYSSSGRITPANRNGIKLITDPGQGLARTYGCDLNNNGISGEATDGSSIACNYISWSDALAYFDWSGLRPMSEMEFEKIARGNQAPVLNQYSWGTTNLNAATSIGANNGALDESISPAQSNANHGVVGSTINGPVRVGAFALNTSTREKAGAGYYGCMELSGNLEELYVCMNATAGLQFTGILGNGELNSQGDADVTNWPTTSGIGTRGGSWSSASTQLTISNRASALTYANGRSAFIGARGAR